MDLTGTWLIVASVWMVLNLLGACYLLWTLIRALLEDRAEGNAFQTLGGKMNTEDKHNIPKGWRIISEGEAIEYINRTEDRGEDAEICPNALYGDDGLWHANRPLRDMIKGKPPYTKYLPYGRKDCGCYIGPRGAFITWMSEEDFRDYGAYFMTPEKLEELKSNKVRKVFMLGD